MTTYNPSRHFQTCHSSPILAPDVFFAPILMTPLTQSEYLLKRKEILVQRLHSPRLCLPVLLAVAFFVVLSATVFGGLTVAQAAPPAQEPVPGDPGADLFLPLIASPQGSVAAGSPADIEIETDGGFVPVDGLLSANSAATIRVTLRIPLQDVRVSIQMGNEPAQDVTAQFAGLESNGTATAVLDLGGGDYALTVTGTANGLQRNGSAHWQIVVDSMLAVASAVEYSTTVTADFSYPHEALTVLVLFTDTVTLEEMSAVLRTHALIPRDIDRNMRMARGEITDGMTPAAKARALVADPKVVAASPNVDLDDRAAVGEAMPARLTNTYQASAGPTCTGGGNNQGCFDHSGNANDELAIFRYHFFIDTFAVHRLVNHLVPKRSVSPTIAILDSGVTIAGANQLDVPAGDFVNMTAMPTRFNSQGQPVNGAGVPVNLNLAAVADPNGHGTAVAAAAAGRGTTNLGPGIHPLVRPVRRGTRVRHDLQAMSMLALDGGVVAVNGSFGLDLDISEPYTDRNRDGFYTFVDVNLSGVYDAGDRGEPFVDLSGDGLWTGRDGRVAAWERTYFRNTVVPAIAPFYRRGFQRLRQPYFDRDGSRTYTAGEPFADTNGNGAYDGARDGKIYVAAAGNNGVSIGQESYPEKLAPTGSRTANDYLLLAVSSVETSDRVHGGEQLSAFSQFGPEISVAAAGGNVLLPDHRGNLNSINGNSFAAPVVTGLLGEMIFLDQNTQVAAKRLSPLQMIELVEVTADDLGTNVAASNSVRPNNMTGNGFDNYFGHGRINAWKAVLSVLNRGIAAESHAAGSHTPAANFPSLSTIDDANTRWYGFKIHSPIHDATVWIDGVRVVDTSSTAPGANIEAYAGVRTDRAILIGVDDNHDRMLDEDPVSGIVPLGSQSDFLATFSIERADLAPVGQRARVLTLRRPGQTAGDDPFFTLELDLIAMRKGEVSGVVFDDFVFEITMPDYGDLIVQSQQNDAHHVQSSLEWLGGGSGIPFEGVSFEHSVVDVFDSDGISNWSLDPGSLFLDDLDWLDNGLTFYPLTYLPGGRGRVDLEVCVQETGARYDAANADKQIYVNGWIDWDTDEKWEEGATKEHVVDGLRLAPVTDDSAGWAVRGLTAGPTNSAVTLKAAVARCGRYEVAFDVPAIGGERLSSRWRLDYGENSGQYTNTLFVHLPGLKLTEGPARYGEVEDYLLGSDFGDAPDEDYPLAPKNYPTKLSRNGARHLSFFREWIGPYGSAKPSASREPDACKTMKSDQDGVDNLANDCTGADGDVLDDFRVTVPEPGLVQVDFGVSTAVRGFGFTGGNSGVPTLKSDCSMLPIAATPSTPAHQRIDMRYNASVATERPYVSIYADWDGNGTFETTLLDASPVDPEDFGADGAYTLGEPFTDTNQDGTWNPGEAYTDVAGVPSRVFSCRFPAPVPPPANVARWVRIRLDYGEKSGTFTRILDPYEEIPSHKMSGPTGGTIWGEVEDASIAGGIPPIKVSTPDVVIPGEVFHYVTTIYGNPNIQGMETGWMDDPLPDLVEFAGNLTCSGGTCEYDEESRTVSWSGSLAPNASITVEFDVQVPEEVPDDWPDIVNKARVYDGLIAHDVEAVTAIQCVPTKISSDSTVAPGQPFDYAITLPANEAATGPHAASITDALPQVLQFQGNLTCSVAGSCDYILSGSTVKWSGVLAPGDDVTVSFRVAIRTDIPPEQCPSVIINEATVDDGLVVQPVGHTVSVLCD
jgi:hypothetical protein